MYEDRMKLWRRTLYLFDDIRHSGWIGPFARANYKRQQGKGPPYIVERQVLDFEGSNYSPDIISSSGSCWAIIELTANDDSKGTILRRYLQINPRNLINYGMTVPDREPDVMSSRLRPSTDDGFPQLIVGSKFSVNEVDGIKDSILKKYLIETIGAELDKIPQIPVTLLPELKGSELRAGLLPIVMQLFDPNHPSYSVVDMVDMGLERLSEAVPISAKVSLRDKVMREMESLRLGKNAPLRDWLELHDNKYRIRLEKVAIKPPRSITDRLKIWADKTTVQLDDFLSSPTTENGLDNKES